MSTEFQHLHTTTVSVQKTASEMMQILGVLGASNISMDMREGKVVGMTFSVVMGEQRLSYRIPVNVTPIRVRMEKDLANRRYRPGHEERMRKAAEQAERTAWRLALQWLKIQAAYVQHGMKHAAEVFLSDMIWQGPAGESTVGEAFLRHKGIAGLIGHAREQA